MRVTSALLPPRAVAAASGSPAVMTWAPTYGHTVSSFTVIWLWCGRYDPLSWEYPSWASINGPAVNILKGALVASDRIVTVSQVRRAAAAS